MKTDEIEYDLILSKNDMLADVWLERSTALEEDTAKGLTHDDILARNY
ncbi:MAG: hypothetical protein SWO11_10135 [Thermodesulfobacteriota bacterium]|nr:hypothetical protein [Thermodesulfobacteriota bacterium]